jgi:hypothetical protein
MDGQDGARPEEGELGGLACSDNGAVLAVGGEEGFSRLVNRLRIRETLSFLSYSKYSVHFN